MKRENLRLANALDYKIREMQRSIEAYQLNRDNRKELPVPGVSIEISISQSASYQVCDIIIADLEIQKAILEKELSDLE